MKTAPFSNCQDSRPLPAAGQFLFAPQRGVDFITMALYNDIS
jgi:hypothetical protein